MEMRRNKIPVRFDGGANLTVSRPAPRAEFPVSWSGAGWLRVAGHYTDNGKNCRGGFANVDELSIIQLKRVERKRIDENARVVVLRVATGGDMSSLAPPLDPVNSLSHPLLY